MAYTRRQELMCTEAQMIAKPNVVLRENEVIYIKMNDGTLRQKIGDGVTTIINLPFTNMYDASGALAKVEQSLKKAEDAAALAVLYNGKSAYAYAKEGGYTGTEAEFAEDINPDNIVNAATENTKGYITEDLKNDLSQSIIEELQGLPVFGVVDENNTITVTSQLSDGTYTLKYENEDGTVTEIGTIVVGTGTGEGSGGEATPPDTTITWAYQTKIGSDGSETSDNNYGASNHIEIVEGYSYTVNRPSVKNKATGIKICYYDADKTYMSTSAEICSASGKEATAAIPLIDGAKYFKLRVNSGSGGTAEYLDGITVTAVKG